MTRNSRRRIVSHIAVALCALSVLVALDPAGVHPVFRHHAEAFRR